MPDKFRNKYRIATTRLQTWDYGANALYFVTICTHNRQHYFGEIINGEMGLSEIGKTVETEWLKTFEMRPDMNLGMGEYVVMPNHFHAIIAIGINKYNTKPDRDGATNNKNNDENTVDGSEMVNGVGDAINDGSKMIINDGNMVNNTNAVNGRDAMHRVSANVPSATVYGGNKFGAQSKNLASVIRGFKSAVTTYARVNAIDFAWQPLFDDRIIRNHQSFQRISDYIRNNPIKWNDDRFYQT